MMPCMFLPVNPNRFGGTQHITMDVSGGAKRPIYGQKFLEMTDAHFNESKVNFRPIAAFLVGKIYYTILHTIFKCNI
jgi:hypothetical protein